MLPLPILGGLFDLGAKLIDRFVPDPAAKAKAQLDLLQMQQSGELAELAASTQLALGQMEINQAEAASGHWFAANWRPLCGWIGGLGLGYAAIIEPIARFVAAVGFGYTGEFPVLDTTITMQILFGMLGLGVMRSYDKVKGTTGK